MPIRVIFRSVFTVPPPSRCIRTILCRDSLPPGILVHSAFELECEGGIHFAELPRVPASHHRMPRGGAAGPCNCCSARPTCHWARAARLSQQGPIWELPLALLNFMKRSLP